MDTPAVIVIDQNAPAPCIFRLLRVGVGQPDRIIKGEVTEVIIWKVDKGLNGEDDAIGIFSLNRPSYSPVLENEGDRFATYPKLEIS